MKKKILLTTLVMVMMISAIGWFFVVYAGTKNDTNSSLNIFFNPKMRRFVEILNIVEESYYRDISEDELIEAALQGMLKKLDPHSVYIFKENDLQNFNMTTKGEFGGIGFRVGIRDERITVISPIENTPASRIGIRAGDIIFQIDTMKTEGMDIDQAVSYMRGKPGTEVVLKIYRFGTEIEYKITREIINIKSIPYYGMLNDSVGYIKVVQFSEHLNKEFNNAMEDLFIKHNAQKLVLDLRQNPGGLLNEAITMSDYFLPRGVNIVSTKSKNSSMEMSFKAQKPVYKGFYPLVVLVDNGSASASEIVAGAIQDWDRGVILGDTTYGKGSVQSVYDFGKYSKGDEGILKFTTARYFTPSGRSIDIELMKYEHSNPDTVIYLSLGGLERTLKGSGGIVPDWLYQERYLTETEIELLRKQVVFGFVAEYLSKNTISENTVKNLTEKIYNEFFEYIKKNDIDTQKIMDDEETMKYVKTQLTREFARQVGGNKLFYEVYLKGDNVINKSLDVLKGVSNTEDMFKKVGEFNNNENE